MRNALWLPDNQQQKMFTYVWPRLTVIISEAEEWARGRGGGGAAWFGNRLLVVLSKIIFKLVTNTQEFIFTEWLCIRKAIEDQFFHCASERLWKNGPGHTKKTLQVWGPSDLSCSTQSLMSETMSPTCSHIFYPISTQLSVGLKRPLFLLRQKKMEEMLSLYFSVSRTFLAS